MLIRALNGIALAIIILLALDVCQDINRKAEIFEELIAAIRQEKCDALDVTWKYMDRISAEEHHDIQKKLIMLADTIGHLNDLKTLLNNDNEEIDRLLKEFGWYIASTREILITELLALNEIRLERMKLWGIGYCGLYQRGIMTEKRQSREKNKQIIEAFLVDRPNNVYIRDSAGYKRGTYKIIDVSKSQIRVIQYEYELTAGDTVNVTLSNNI